jgi:uncharacterized protein (DUF2384 family)
MPLEDAMTAAAPKTTLSYFEQITNVTLPRVELERLIEGQASVPPEGHSMKTITQRLKDVLALTQDESARLLGVSRGTVLKAGPPTQDVLDRLYALSVSLDTMSGMLGDQAVFWFRTPNPALGDARPLDKFRTRYGQEQVEDLIQGLMDGNFL